MHRGADGRRAFDTGRQPLNRAMIEHREGVSFRVAGRTLSGRALVYGDVSPDFQERFLPGAFGEVRSIAVNFQHDQKLVVADEATLIDSARWLEVRADLPEGSAALDLVRRGALSAFSIEFKSKAERREAGIRVVERAELTGLALVDRGAYPQSLAEIRKRSGRVLRSKLPYDRALACECIAKSGSGSGGACVPLARFSKMAGDLMANAINEASASAGDILAVAGNFRRPLGSVSRGTLRATSTDDGLDIEIDLPAGTVGDEIVAAHESAGVIVRPLINMDRSEFVDTDRGREYTKPHVRAFIVGATDTKKGWDDAVIEEVLEGPPTTTKEKIAALSKLSKRRRRVWY